MRGNIVESFSSLVQAPSAGFVPLSLLSLFYFVVVFRLGVKEHTSPCSVLQVVIVFVQARSERSWV